MPAKEENAIAAVSPDCRNFFGKIPENELTNRRLCDIIMSAVKKITVFFAGTKQMFFGGISFGVWLSLVVSENKTVDNCFFEGKAESKEHRSFYL
ncbi:MAG: hypothetical protein MJ082_02660 [Clostridia bacterium]|nr:hypothetical protein [Clostridia bacterium]